MGEALQLRLAATAVEHCLSGVFELHAELGILGFRSLACLQLGDILLLDSHRGQSGQLRFPVLLPLRIRLDQLGLGQPRARLLQQVALMHLVRPHLMPCRPAHCKLLVHHALDALLAQSLHALLLLLLQLLFTQPLQLRLAAVAIEHCRARRIELGPQLEHLLAKVGVDRIALGRCLGCLLGERHLR